MTQPNLNVAVLLATYNGARYIGEQIASLRENATPFTIHWLDDHSTDNTREVVRAAVAEQGIDLKEWHQPQREKIPGVFFRLLECVEADIYLFCDQDDIWQPGKIDATVADLLPDVTSPALCFSDPWAFRDGDPAKLYRLSDVIRIDAVAALQVSRSFMLCPAIGHTIGITRPLRDLYVSHSEIARAHSGSHDWWMYLIAIASGRARMLSNAPTTLYRLHTQNTSGVNFARYRFSPEAIIKFWHATQSARRWDAKQATGFCLASSTLPLGPQREHALTLARLVAKLDRRQSLAALIRLVRLGTLPPSGLRAVAIATACLCSHADG